MSDEIIGEYTTVDNAYLFARDAHSGQKDDGGYNYFQAHCMQVYYIVTRVRPFDYNLRAAALLHDVIEETKITYEDIKIRFGQDIADLVNEVTHERNTADDGWCFPRLKTVRGYILKFADRTSNLSRMENAWTEEKIKKYMAKSVFWDTGE